jgi:hypothetical protein
MATRPPIGCHETLAAFGRFEAEIGGGTGGAGWFGGPTGPRGDEGADGPVGVEAAGVVVDVGAFGPAAVELCAAGAVVDAPPDAAIALVPVLVPVLGLVLETELAAAGSPAAV